MSDQTYVQLIAAVVLGYFVIQVLTRKFDPFAPIWLFFVGYLHLYVIQPYYLREWAMTIRGVEIVTAANERAFWALLLFIAVYLTPIGKGLAACLPAPPTGWSSMAIVGLTPMLVLWGFYCAWVVVTQGWGGESSEVSAEVTLFRSFPFVMMVAAILLLITGRSGEKTKPIFTAAGLALALAYVGLWMFNGKRSHSLIGVLSTVCAFYIAKRRRPSWPVLFTTAFTGALVVALAIGWRNNPNYTRSLSGFVQYMGDFQVTAILDSLNIEEGEDADEKVKSYETLEYGGYLLMLDTVPEKSDYDYGANYLRTFSTFIPRIIWADKPIFGRDKWIAAWMAGSEMKRDEDFTGPAIGILGATQLNGGAIGTLIVMSAVAVMIRTGYEYFRRHDHVPWVQAWWALTYYNAWFMVVNDDPMIWFYYNWGITCFPNLTLLWVVNRIAPSAASSREPSGLALGTA